MAAPDFAALRFKAGSIFTPGAPVNEKDLFAGRKDEMRKILDAVSQRGLHAVLYGDRGVGKTSLANVLSAFLEEKGVQVFFPRTTCDASDTFTSLWRKIFKNITITRTRTLPGFGDKSESSFASVLDQLPTDITPDDVRAVLSALSTGTTLIVGIDEFDRIKDPAVPALMADTIKALSDNAVPATIFLIGVADSVDELISEHRSIERALVQVPMPRMSKDEVKQVLIAGLSRLGMTADPEAVSEIVNLSQGLPYITHLLALHSVRAALDREEMKLSRGDVQNGISKSLEAWQQSIVTAYYEATKSQQPGHLYKEVLLACAFAETDDKDYFTAAAVRTPLRVIARPDLDIPNFSRHLKEFSDAKRGSILVREGETKRLRYRFVGPLMRPYIIMRGYKDGLLTAAVAKQLAK